MLINQAPLAARAAALRNGTLDLMRYLGEVCDRIEALEPTVQALAPEADRRARLLREAADCSAGIRSRRVGLCSTECRWE